jgi:hypothetical protein
VNVIQINNRAVTFDTRFHERSVEDAALSNGADIFSAPSHLGVIFAGERDVTTILTIITNFAIETHYELCFR